MGVPVVGPIPNQIKPNQTKPVTWEFSSRNFAFHWPVLPGPVVGLSHFKCWSPSMMRVNVGLRVKVKHPVTCQASDVRYQR